MGDATYQAYSIVEITQQKLLIDHCCEILKAAIEHF